MPRYIVERTFPNGLDVPANAQGAAGCARIVARNAREGVTWLHSYVSVDQMRTYCVYDGPSPDAIRAVAQSNELPIGSITEVSVLNPYFHH